jgi:hypothetical protein
MQRYDQPYSCFSEVVQSAREISRASGSQPSIWGPQSFPTKDLVPMPMRLLRRKSLCSPPLASYALNPIEAWLPSQKGLLLDAPQRQSLARLRISYLSPSALTTMAPPRTHSGPEMHNLGPSTRPIEGLNRGSIATLVSLFHAPVARRDSVPLRLV